MSSYATDQKRALHELRKLIADNSGELDETSRHEVQRKILEIAPLGYYIKTNPRTSERERVRIEALFIMDGANSIDGFFFAFTVSGGGKRHSRVEPFLETHQFFALDPV